VDSPGDNLLAEFASVVDAVRCGVEIQQELKGRNAELPSERRMEYRIGINLGDVVVEGERLYGDGVNIAARLEGLAEPGGICISGTVYDHVETKLPLTYEYLGEQTVKNIARPVRVWRVVMDAAAATLADQGVLRQAQRERTSIPVPLGLSKGDRRLLLPDKPSIAVLPFLNLSGDPKQEYFSDGLTEDLITDLSRFSGLFVIARTSVFTYKGKAVKVQEVSKELGVRYVLEGSVRKAADRVRITAQLVDATTGHHLWAERYDREQQDLFALQDELTQQLVSSLNAEVRQAELERVRRIPTANLTAYDYFLRGSESYWDLTQESNLRARQLWEKAIELDPQYAEAYAWLGWTYWVEWSWFWSQDPQNLERALELAHQASALDDSLPLAHMLLGGVSVWKKQYELAIAEGKRAIALNPNDPQSHFWLASTQNLAGQPEAALELAERAMRLDPRNREWYLWEVGWAYTLTGRIEEASATLKSVLTWHPTHLPAHLLMAGIYSALGREEEARAEVAEILRISPTCSLEVFRQRTPYKNPVLNELAVDLLRKAGLK
jgi:adenylate cyclase